MSCRVFISYSSKEMEFAVKVCEYLENNGIQCWIAPRNVIPGSNYATQIVSAIKSSEVLVLLASKNTNESAHVSNEVSLAFDSKKQIIPFKLQDFEFTDEYLYFLGRKHWIEAHQDMNAGMEMLKNTIFSIVPQKNEKIELQPEQKSEPVDTNTASVTNSKGSAEYSRAEIVDIITEKSLKYPYNLYRKLDTDEKYARFCVLADKLFSETTRCYKQNKLICEKIDLVNLLINQMSSGEGQCINVQGLPGSAKNMLLQLAFYKMLNNFKAGFSNYLPFYISASYYEKIPYNPEDVAGQMKDIISKELYEFFNYIENNRDVKPVLFIEAIREHYVAKVTPENIVFELWRKFGKFNRVTTVDVGLIKNRSRIRRVIPILGDVKGYSVTMNSVPIDDEVSCLAVIDAVANMYEYDIEPKDVYRVCRHLKLTTVDIFLVRLVVKEMLSTYDVSDIRLSDMYEKLALSELYGDEDKLDFVATELFDYLFDEAYNVNSIRYNGAVWSLPHKHNTYLEFLIAYYIVKKLEKCSASDDVSFFGKMLTSTANHFLGSFLCDNYALQDTLVRFVFENYSRFNIQQKSNAAYRLGRITFKNLVSKSVGFLNEEFNRLKPLVKSNNKNDRENCDNHFLFRSVCSGLLSLGQTSIMDEYLCVVVTNDIANAVSRGSTIEYFGDNYQMAAHELYYLDTDLSSGEQAIKILSSRIENSLEGNSGDFVENNLVVLLTLLQARMQNKRVVLKFNITHYVEKALHYLRVYHTLPQNIVSTKLIYYFKSVEEDFELYLKSEKFDIGPIIFNRYRNLKQIKRVQWVSHNIKEPESVSDHTFSAWMMAMMFLPEESDDEGYCKREILDMLLVHDMAEAVVGDQAIDLAEPMKELKMENDVLRKLFLKGTYPDIANLTHYYNVWTGYYSGLNINARTARDLNLLQTVYTFFEYYTMYPENFSTDEITVWVNEKANLNTELGHELFDRLITKNPDFKHIIESV